MGNLILLLFVIGLALAFFRERNGKSVTSTTKKQVEDDQAARHLRKALSFAEGHLQAITNSKLEHEAWQQRYGAAKANELDQLSGVEFERFLSGLLQAHGYTTELTATSGDFGAGESGL